MIMEKLRNELKDAMKSSDKAKIRTVRLLMAQVKNFEIEKGGELTENEFNELVLKEIRKRKEAIEMYEKAKRNDLVNAEREELEILERFLPEQLSMDELKRMVIETIESVEATGPQDLGKVMSVLMPKIKGRADGKVVNKIVREFLER